MNCRVYSFLALSLLWIKMPLYLRRKLLTYFRKIIYKTIRVKMTMGCGKNARKIVQIRPASQVLWGCRRVSGAPPRPWRFLYAKTPRVRQSEMSDAAIGSSRMLEIATYRVRLGIVFKPWIGESSGLGEGRRLHTQHARSGPDYLQSRHTPVH